MGLNRMMMKNGEVKVEDGRKTWDFTEVDNKTISFTVPPGIKRIKVVAVVDSIDGNSENARRASIYASIENKMTNKTWGKGFSVIEELFKHQNINSIVGVTPNKTYALMFKCYYTSGVTFSWGKVINAMTPTVEDY